LDSALKLICKNPAIGQAKEGDVLGLYVYKFKLLTLARGIFLNAQLAM